MAKELEITSIICFLSALIAACSRRLFIKTKRDSKRRDSSEGVKKTREVWVESHNVLHPSRLNPTFLTFSLLRCFLTVYNFVPFYELNACNRLPSLVFFSFSTEDYFRIEYFVVIHDLYFQALLCWTSAYWNTSFCESTAH